MKKLKLTRKVQIILAMIFVIVAGIIIVGSVSHKNVSAASLCSCGGEGVYYTYPRASTGKHYQEIWCSSCGTSLGTYGPYSCTPSSWVPSTTVSGTHAKYCIYCHYATTTGTCYDNDDDGICDVCGDDRYFWRFWYWRRL